jgi:hypothetical protein
VQGWTIRLAVIGLMATAGTAKMGLRRVLGCALVTVLFAGRASAQTPDLLRFPEDETKFAVRLAVEGAATRLTRRSCQGVLADFTDASGERLSTKLVATGKSPADAFRSLLFADDRDAPQCRRGVTLAFTQTGSRFIHVCGRHFRNAFLLNRATTEIILIHEFLHALGLGENPPTSQEITERVTMRCDRWTP